MSSFAYTARDRDGNARSGVVDARDVEDAREVIRSRELFVISLKRKSEGDGITIGTRKKKVKLGDLVVMSRQFATLFRAGISVIECLNAVARQSENPTLTAALMDVRQGVLEGLSVSEAMRRHPKVFNEKFVALVKAGETGGVLEQTLEVAADQFDREAELQEKIRSAMVYPAIVVLSAVGVVIFMLLFIVPVFQDVYKGFGAQLPGPTLLLISISDILMHRWLLVMIITGAIIYAFKRFIATKKGKKLYHRFLLKVPILGPLNRKVAISRFTETLAGGVRAGIPILQALSVAAQTCGNVVINDVVEKAAILVQEGAPLAKPLEQSKEFPPLVTYMISAGEQSGNLDTMLAEITRFYSRDIEYAVTRLTRAMEPLMTIVIGVVVLGILLALYLPVFAMTQVLHK